MCYNELSDLVNELLKGEIKMTKVAEFKTGSKRGYCSVKEEGIESDFYSVPESVKGLRGNFRKAMEVFIENGCDSFTISKYQYYTSNQFHYYVYHGYKTEF